MFILNYIFNFTKNSGFSKKFLPAPDPIRVASVFFSFFFFFFFFFLLLFTLPVYRNSTVNNIAGPNIFSSAAAHASESGNGPAEYKISGKVMDIFNGAQIYKAVVSFNGEEFLTSASGHYSAKLSQGVYSVSVTHENYHNRIIKSYSVSGNESYDYYLIPESFDLREFDKFGGYSLNKLRFSKPPVFIINTGYYNGSKSTFDKEHIEKIISVINQLRGISDFFKNSSIVRQNISKFNDIPSGAIVFCRDDYADYTEGGHAQFIDGKHSSLIVINPLYNSLVGFFEVVTKHELMHAIGFYTHAPFGYDSILVPSLPMPPDYTDIDRKVIKLFYSMPPAVAYPHVTDFK